MEFDWMTAVKAGLTAVIGAFTAFWGWMGWLAFAWVVLMALDYITGTAAAVKAGNWSSKTAREGIWHKLGELVVVIVAALADRVLVIVIENLPVVAFNVPGAGLLLPLVLVWYCITELGSIAENAALMGAPVPEWLRKVLEAGKKAADEAGDAVTGEAGDTEEKNG